LHIFVAGVKTLVAILLLFLTSAGIFLVPVIFKIKQARIHRAVRNQVRRGISREHLHTFKSFDSEIQWKERDKEFSYRGEMYDVVAAEEKDGVTTYYCLNDKEEQELNLAIGKLANKTGRDASGSITRGLFSILVHGLLPPQTSLVTKATIVLKKYHPGLILKSYMLVVKSVNEPPPWLV